jgi:hypothetical protein
MACVGVPGGPGGEDLPVKHFIGGFAVGLMFALWKITLPRPISSMGDYELGLYVLVHAITASLFGIAAWGLL